MSRYPSVRFDSSPFRTRVYIAGSCFHLEDKLFKLKRSRTRHSWEEGVLESTAPCLGPVSFSIRRFAPLSLPHMEERKHSLPMHMLKHSRSPLKRVSRCPWSKSTVDKVNESKGYIRSVSNGFGSMGPCEQSVYFCENKLWSNLSCEQRALKKIQTASSEHFVNLPPAEISHFWTEGKRCFAPSCQKPIFTWTTWFIIVY